MFVALCFVPLLLVCADAYAFQRRTYFPYASSNRAQQHQFGLFDGTVRQMPRSGNGFFSSQFEPQSPKAMAGQGRTTELMDAPKLVREEQLAAERARLGRKNCFFSPLQCSFHNKH